MLGTPARQDTRGWSVVAGFVVLIVVLWSLVFWYHQRSYRPYTENVERPADVSRAGGAVPGMLG